MKINKELLEYFDHYIWWEDGKDDLRIIINAMQYVNNVEDFLKICEFADEVLKQDDDTLVFMTINKVQLSFLGKIDFVKITHKIQSDILQIASLKDLPTTKLKAIAIEQNIKIIATLLPF